MSFLAVEEGDVRAISGTMQGSGSLRAEWTDCIGTGSMRFLLKGQHSFGIKDESAIIRA